MTNEYESGIVEAVSLGGFRGDNPFRGRNQSDILPKYAKPEPKPGYDFGQTIDDTLSRFDGLGGIVDIVA